MPIPVPPRLHAGPQVTTTYILHRQYSL